MRRLVNEGAGDPLVRANALRVTRASPELHPADAIFYHVRSFPYVEDQHLARAAGFKGSGVSEVLQGAPYQVKKELEKGTAAVVGDCDCRSIYVQSALESLGYPTRFAVVRGNGSSLYSHVYSEVKLEDGSWRALDTIMDGKDGRPLFKPGEELPSTHARDKTVFPVRSSRWVPWVLAGVVALALRGR
jgi:hypothetical protein